jgi:hypothetical protein
MREKQSVQVTTWLLKYAIRFLMEDRFILPMTYFDKWLQIKHFAIAAMMKVSPQLSVTHAAKIPCYFQIPGLASLHPGLL